MRLHSSLPVQLLLLSTLTATGQIAPLLGQASRPTGTWCLDTTLSDKAPPRPGANWASPPPGAGGERGEGRRQGPGGEGGGYSGGGRRPGRDLSDKDLERVAQTMGLLRDPPTRLRFSPRDSLTLSDADGSEMLLRINGKSHRESVPEGGDVETGAEWKGPDLVIERRVKGGGRVRETYQRGLEQSRLLAYVEIVGLFQPVNLRRQYQRVEGECAVGEP